MLEAGQSEFGEVETPSHILGTGMRLRVCMILFSPLFLFPPTWPVYAPVVKPANWLEHYAEIFELNVWLSLNITSIDRDPVWDSRYR
ncbi:uncharacterized protein LACBIDRAFT_314321 [Laccaria bicolor S238N-H82]|uniref:Predicted protein n=1 Tax=Laccaria bicolor (strain S238N-H82 / ATCC MYA-4686) TaxID=486041 RepID=B0DYA4_LACBS|nr:uncharacterized protein LACBIDRAFT_314321 [Laccaria bicolor S238N-H82]EDR00354.1 predicted protein [Laccaria bicolor S238N-H82]|eukprot:XP_001888913.1 predicted protein [Laccaria bicolor S238N-H82]